MSMLDAGPARPPHPGPFDARTMQPVPVAKVLAVLDHYRSSTLYPEYRDALSAAIRIVEFVTAADPHPLAVENALLSARREGVSATLDALEPAVHVANRTVCRIAGVEPVR